MDLKGKTETELDFILLNEKIEAKQYEINLLKRELYDLQSNRFNEIYMGKFWKYSLDENEVYYSYCKQRSNNEYRQIYGIFDYVKIRRTTDGLKTVSFKKNFEEHVMLFCKIEITREEYEKALDELKEYYLNFIDISRKILIEKNLK